MLSRLLGPRQIGVRDASAMVSNNEAILVDVRTKQEWKAGRAPQARHISLASLQGRLARLPEDTKILVICESGNRSATAVRAMRRAGLEAHNVRGGMDAWKRANLPVTRR